MRTILIRKVTGFVALASLTACPLVVSLASSIPSQGGISASAKSTIDVKPEAEKVAKNPVLARNTASKTETATPTAAPKAQKTHDSKTITRCWQRLMNMVREVNHAHRAAKK